MMYGLSIGLSLTYDGGLYLRDLKVVDAGAELLWKVLRYARINNHAELRKVALGEFAIAADGAKRGGDKDAVALVRLYRRHALTGDWRNPKYPDKLLNRIL